MSVDLFFINDTKKEVVSSKVISSGFEDGQQLMAYLKCCKGDSIRIKGEDDPVVWDFLYEENGKYSDYTEINIDDFTVEKDVDLTMSNVFSYPLCSAFLWNFDKIFPNIDYPDENCGTYRREFLNETPITYLSKVSKSKLMKLRLFGKQKEKELNAICEKYHIQMLP